MKILWHIYTMEYYSAEIDKGCITNIDDNMQNIKSMI